MSTISARRTSSPSGPEDIITVGPGGHRIYRLKAYSKSVHLPPSMQEDLGRGEVILCVFDLK